MNLISKLKLVALPLLLAATPAAPLLAVVPAPATLPAADALLLATLPVRITPKREVTVTAPLTGQFTLLVPHATQTIADQTTWGAIDLDRLELEARALAQAKTLYDARDVIDWRVNQINERTKLEDTLGRLKAERALLNRLAQNPELADLYFRDQAAAAATSNSVLARDSEPPPDAPSKALAKEGPDRIPLMRRRIETELTLLETKLSYLGSAQQEDLELGLSRFKLEQQAFEYQRRAQLARLTAPFDAEFRLLLPLKPGSTTMEVRSGDDIARLRDLTSILIQVPVTQPLWRTLPPESLEVRIPLDTPERVSLRARFHDTLLVTRSGREELLYLFAVAPADLAAARPLVGGLLQGELYYAPGTSLRLAQKLDLAAAAPAILREAGWPALVASLYPGWRLACIGQHQLALLPPPVSAPAP